jgi:hypothetical protein
MRISWLLGAVAVASNLVGTAHAQSGDALYAAAKNVRCTVLERRWPGGCENAPENPDSWQVGRFPMKRAIMPSSLPGVVGCR